MQVYSRCNIPYGFLGTRSCVLSKAEDLGLLSLLENVSSTSPAALASASLPIFLVVVVAVVMISDDSDGLVALQVVVAGALGVGSVGLFIGSVVSVVLDGLQGAN
ncbi:hypothetical protein QYF36_002466 [Acer negundo]|nr:hypothetical protein QYF36_002466 [Acer negundo]